jgi:hypothetical protein
MIINLYGAVASPANASKSAARRPAAFDGVKWGHYSEGYPANTRSSRGSGKLTCSSRTVRLSTVAP